MLAAPVRTRCVPRVGVGIAAETSDASVVAIATHIRIVVDGEWRVVEVYHAMSMRRRRGRSESGYVDFVGCRREIALGIPRFHIEGVLSGRKGDPGISRGREIPEDVLVVHVHHVAGDLLLVFGRG